MTDTPIPEDIMQAARDLVGDYLDISDSRNAQLAKFVAKAILAERQLYQWQSMESAPKDRSAIILALASGRVTVGHWLDNSKTQWPWVGWSTDAGPYLEKAVTAWQPLPAPPAAKGA